jgi:hypothetical protein
MAIAYAVSSGEYSDYGVIAIFTSKEKAVEFLGFYPPDDETFLEEFPLDEMPEYPAGCVAWRVNIARDGRCECEQVSPDRVSDGKLFPHYMDDGRMSTFLWARDAQHAAKIANEKRAQAVAAGTWETDLGRYRDLKKRMSDA